jgi:adenosine deaminase
MSLHDFIQAMPKAELHVHLQGATQPETLLKLAQRNNIDLPADDMDGMREWYAFQDFSHFIDIYDVICQCIQTPDDLELVMREFIAGQAAQNIRYTEVTYTPTVNRMSSTDQLQALDHARKWGEATHGVKVNIVIDIPRGIDDLDILRIADIAIEGMDYGVVAFGLGGPEAQYPPELFKKAFDRTLAAGLPSVPHAGEVDGPKSIWGALNSLHAVRIGHGVRCLEDPALVDELRNRQIPLEVCPTSNICLGVFGKIEEHPLPRLIDEGLYVTLNSDDPPMFNTTLTDEYHTVANVFGFDAGKIEQLVINALRAAFLPGAEKGQMETEFKQAFAQLKKTE